MTAPRRNLVPFSCCVLAAFLAMTGCAAAHHAPPRPARINHVVFFKLKDPAEAQDLIRDCDHLLATVPGIVAGCAGTHLEPARPDSDSDYDVAFYAGFMNEEDYKAYEGHPAHAEAVAKWGPRLQWLRVYDVVDGTP